MEKAFKMQIYPTLEQIILINKTFGCSRYIYNHFLDFKRQEYKTHGNKYNYYDTCKLLTALKKEIEWLREVDKCALQNSLKDLDNAFKRFFKGAGYPNFKAKHYARMAYRTTFSNNNIEFLEDAIKLPKLGKVKIKDKLYRPRNGRILNATISKTKTGKYFISICYTDIEIEPLPKTGYNVGIDLGLKSFITTSDFYKVDNPKFLEKSEEKLKKLHRLLSRKPKVSKNREKARLKLAKGYEKVTNQRNDFLHKLSKRIVENYDTIVIEDLKVRNLLKNHYLAKSISSASWYKFTNMLEYKARFYGKTVIRVNQFFPSSQLCSNCSFKNEKVKDLRVRAWECPNCGAINDRDLNASQNILKEGLRILVAEKLIEFVQSLI